MYIWQLAIEANGVPGMGCTGKCIGEYPMPICNYHIVFPLLGVSNTLNVEVVNE
jgi:hypothetical protein